MIWATTVFLVNDIVMSRLVKCYCATKCGYNLVGEGMGAVVECVSGAGMDRCMLRITCYGVVG